MERLMLKYIHNLAPLIFFYYSYRLSQPWNIYSSLFILTAPLHMNAQLWSDPRFEHLAIFLLQLAFTHKAFTHNANSSARRAYNMVATSSLIACSVAMLAGQDFHLYTSAGLSLIASIRILTIMIYQQNEKNQKMRIVVILSCLHSLTMAGALLVHIDPALVHHFLKQSQLETVLTLLHPSSNICLAGAMTRFLGLSRSSDDEVVHRVIEKRRRASSLGKVYLPGHI